jgi:hypothetical protein
MVAPAVFERRPERHLIHQVARRDSHVLIEPGPLLLGHGGFDHVLHLFVDLPGLAVEHKRIGLYDRDRSGMNRGGIDDDFRSLRPEQPQPDRRQRQRDTRGRRPMTSAGRRRGSASPSASAACESAASTARIMRACSASENAGVARSASRRACRASFLVTSFIIIPVLMSDE